jgi:hypothetical protein
MTVKTSRKTIKAWQTYMQQFASMGGKARAAKLSQAEQSEIGRKAASARWAGHVKKNPQKSA